MGLRYSWILQDTLSISIRNLSSVKQDIVLTYILVIYCIVCGEFSRGRFISYVYCNCRAFFFGYTTFFGEKESNTVGFRVT